MAELLSICRSNLSAGISLLADSRSIRESRYGREGDYFQNKAAVEYPAHTAARPSTVWPMILPKAKVSSPSRRRFIVSLPNAEKVVNPPRIPTVRKTLVSAETTPR